ncbi:hypothetical protein [Lacinutrix undariae]
MLYKKNIKPLLVLGVILISHITFAHQPDVSNIIISKTENGQIILQINSSLTAFQEEVIYKNGKGAYKTPEEFEALAIAHFNTSFSFIVNENDTLQFKNTKLFLGHETKLVTEIIGLPKTVNIIQLKNELFKDIHNNQSTVIFLLEGFPKEKHVLKQDNNHQIHLVLNDETWENTATLNAGFNPVYIIIILGIAILFFIIKKKRKTIKS